MAAAMVFTGCSQDEGGDSDMINESGNKAEIDKTNDTENDYLRGFKTIRDSEQGTADCIIKIENADASGSSVMGFVFDESETTDTDNETVYSFYLLGVKYADNKAQCYLSRFDNVKSSELTGNTTAFGSETAYWKGASGSYAIIDGLSKAADGSLTVRVSVTQSTAGQYVVNLYDADGNAISLTNESKVNLPSTDTKQQGYIGFYANVVSGKTLKGSWDITAKKSLVPVEE